MTRKRRPWPHPELAFSCPARPGGICLALIIYLLGDSWFSVRKAPYDTKPYHLNLTFVDYRSFNVTNPSHFSDGQKFTDDIYLSDEYFIRQDEIFQRIEADEIPKELVLPLTKLE